jgi:hypothetical protein
LLNHAHEQLNPRLTLTSTDERRAADLVENGSCALRCRRVDRILLKRIDGLQLAPSSEQTELTAAVSCRNGGSVGQVDSRQPSLNDASCCGIQSIEEPLLRQGR